MTVETPQEAARRLAKSVLQKGFKPEALHTYYDPDSQPLYWRIRLKHPKTQAKWIRPMHQPKDQEFILGEPDFTAQKPLYHLPEILNRPKDVVWIIEGEWCADHLARLGVLVTTSGSADSVGATDWTPLAGRRVIIWPDNDTAGLKYAQAILKTLRKLNSPVQWIDVAALNLPPKGDCVDWLSNHPQATTHDLDQLPRKVLPHIEPTRPDKKTLKSSFTSTFTVNDQGVFYHDEDEKRWICSRLSIQALVRDKASENWGRLLELTDADGRLHRWSMPMEMLKGSGEELRGELLRLGLQIAPGMKARQRLVEYISTTKPETRARCVTQTGWHDGIFVLPDQTIGETSEPLIYQADHLINPYQQSGTLADWQTHISAHCMGNSRLLLAVSCAFAALLLHPAGAESGGLHLVGESSTGKTTALKVAASVFGAPNYLQRWRATANGLESLAALRSDTLLVLDELAQVDPKEAGEVAYMLANGSGKARAGKNGAARSRQEWRLLFLSAGEVGLAQHISESGKRIKAGQTVRLVDIPADAGQGLGLFDVLHDYASGAALSHTLIEAAARYYGTAAISFLERITPLAEWCNLTHAVKERSSAFIKKNLPPQYGGQLYRVGERFALIAAAGELATHYGITTWPPGEAEQAVARCFQDWIDYRGGADNQEYFAILAHIRRFFEMHGESRFSAWEETQNSHTLYRAGFKKAMSFGVSYYVLPEVFREELCAGFDYRAVTRLLLTQGWLEPGDNQAPYRREYLPGIGRSRCYVFLPTLWQDEKSH